MRFVEANCLYFQVCRNKLSVLSGLSGLSKQFVCIDRFVEKSVCIVRFLETICLYCQVCRNKLSVLSDL